MNTKSPFRTKISKLTSDFNPVNAAIELTHRCNAQCGYCYLPEHSGTDELTTSQIHFILDKLDSSGILFINLTGGDPFIRDDINEILEHLFSCNFFFCSIFTNGTNLTQNHINLLVENRKKVKSFRMTLFSHIPSVHDSYMKIAGSYSTIFKTAMDLISRDVRASILIPLMDFNIDHIHDAISYFQKSGLSVGINTTKLITSSNYSDALQQMTTVDFFSKYFNSLSNTHLEHMIKSRKINPKFGTSLCRGIQDSIVIDVKGKIHPCTAFRNFTIGSIFEDRNIPEILSRNSNYNKLRAITKSSLSCTKCDYASICFPCLAVKHSYDNTFDGPYEQRCNFTSALVATCLKRGINAFSK
jgi:radical SAM protein with 4Fe4S-binding SPASM domain